MGEKSPQAFRTIREVADWLGVEAHVLRFWESKFSQIKPVKRAGGRRYYRPADMKLIGGIKVMLHDQGLTIRGAQKRIQDEGVAQISALSPPLEEELEAEAARTVEQAPAEAVESAQAPPAPTTGFVDIDALAGDDASERQTDAPPQDPETRTEPEPEQESEPEPVTEPEPETETETEEARPDAVAAQEAPPSETDPNAEPAAAAPADSTSTAPSPRASGQTAPTTPLSEIRALLHKSVPLSESQRAQLGPLVARLDALATRLRSGKHAE